MEVFYVVCCLGGSAAIDAVFGYTPGEPGCDLKPLEPQWAARGGCDSQTSPRQRRQRLAEGVDGLFHRGCFSSRLGQSVSSAAAS